jgi:flagellin-like protein
MNKKGISPLIATVLIIGFTVALAAVIMTWGQSFSKSMSQSTEETTAVQLACAQDVQFDLTNVCHDGAGNLKLTVENNGNKDLDEITARIKKDQSTIDVVSALTIDVGLSAFGLDVYDVFEADLVNVVNATAVTEVELIPLITVGGKQVTCANAVARFGDVVKGETIAEC